MERLYCPYCGELLTVGCSCERSIRDDMREAAHYGEPYNEAKAWEDCKQFCEYCGKPLSECCCECKVSKTEAPAETVIGKIIDTRKEHCLVPSVHIGNGKTDNGKEFEIATTWGQEPLIIFEGKYYLLKWSDICNLAEKAGLFNQNDKKEVI